jgi:hypothetical protein
MLGELTDIGHSRDSDVECAIFVRYYGKRPQIYDTATTKLLDSCVLFDDVSRSLV